MERDRRGRRIIMNCRLFFFGEDEFEGEARLLDLSTSGCKAESQIPLQVGAKLKLSIFLPDQGWPLRVDLGVIRWVTGLVFGLEFLTIRPAQRERLRALVMSRR